MRHYSLMSFGVIGLFRSGPYSLGLAATGVLALLIGAAFAADYKDVAGRWTARRARWPIAPPLWLWRVWGAWILICGVMAIIQ